MFQQVENHCLRTVSGAYKAALVQSLQAEVPILPLPLYTDGWQARYCLRSAELGINRVVGESIVKVTQFLICTKTRPRHPRTPRN